MENIKNFSNELQYINDLNELASKRISVFLEDKFISQGVLFKENNKFFCRLPIILVEDCLENVTIKIGDENCIFTTLEVKTRSSVCGEKGVFINTVCSIWYLKNNAFNIDFVSKFRCFIPADPSLLNTFRFQLESIKYCNSVKEYGFQCVRIKIGNIRLDVLQVKLEQQGYYVIDSLQTMSFGVFADYCYAIQQAIGFVMGYMPGNKIYYFTDHGDFYYTANVRPAMKLLHYPIHINPYHFKGIKRTIADSYWGKLNVLSVKDFSRLIYLLYSDERFSSVIVMMIESESVRSLLLMPSIYSIILEALSKIICVPNVEEKKPIRSKKLFQKISNDIYGVIDSYSGIFESGDDVSKLKKRVPELNKIVKQNHLTNHEKLVRPFEQLGIELSIDDINIIKHRNDLLHGNIFLTDNKKQEFSDINNYMMYVSEKLYTLISSLILKYIGYSGYIINYAKTYEEDCNITTNEDYYKYI